MIGIATHFLIGLLFALGSQAAEVRPSPKLTVVNLNIRYDNPEDGAYKWENRIPIVRSFFNQCAPDLIGFQEVTQRQLGDLAAMLPAYGFVGRGRNDGLAGGEFNPIFYRKDRFELLENATFWLSESPDVAGSVGWDAQLPRIVTWAKLKDRTSGKLIFHFNTHFDNKGMESRFKGVDLLCEKIAEIAGESPTIATGDFNIRKDHPRYGKEPYIYLREKLSERLQMRSAEFVAKRVISDGATGNGFEENWQERPPHAVDYIFVDPNFQVSTYQVEKIIENGVFIADHWPVVAKMTPCDP
ncbi:Metal-dependent hydrolase, endonuclease/exonuclease/phosphatase family [Cyclobacterium lianum]|uniref:Metal-dependent hydrolase, endonuclease/exonuclease/phosphatase family n=1 Tax=Cyclobacterium lianum TaxID=388280 RepID=A0A1M7PRA8_9BACT|nr:endonuclease/exonuclease/phosphatase family protein [Cyclobacterium lianum]SHN19922.1 Metal-dependent hydrolase, endonuclease/exonuclease/phosphatase family [Cyclobacterium lianum]